ncbi:sporulation protein [Deinococcus roseus]|uniref:Sporulation-control protein n=1 Tax=Deinococcus roseus TaxID=392414 RepID=A0ABQ2D641_9DEIO|nr:sporulation protein [Deinococcus roseus]GGJ44991.1 sporulation-control protein [Deinococcus roseus]
MFTQFLAKVGIGAAQIDTQLSKNTFYPGEIAEGRIVVRGGSAAQEIEYIKLQVCSQYKSDDSTVIAVLSETVVSERFVIQPGETRTFPLQLQIPYTVPLSYYNTPVWLYTAAAISAAIDPKDNDRLNIAPSPLQAAVLEALTTLGFHLKASQYEFEDHKHHRPLQELEFQPAPEFRGRMKELEVVFLPAEHHLDVLLEVDRKARGISRLFTSEVESKGLWRVTPEMKGNLGPLLHQKIQNLL